MYTTCVPGRIAVTVLVTVSLRLCVCVSVCVGANEKFVSCCHILIG